MAFPLSLYQNPSVDNFVVASVGVASATPVVIAFLVAAIVSVFADFVVAVSAVFTLVAAAVPVVDAALFAAVFAAFLVLMCDILLVAWSLSSSAPSSPLPSKQRRGLARLFYHYCYCRERLWRHVLTEAFFRHVPRGPTRSAVWSTPFHHRKQSFSQYIIMLGILKRTCGSLLAREQSPR